MKTRPGNRPPEPRCGCSICCKPFATSNAACCLYLGYEYGLRMALSLCTTSSDVKLLCKCPSVAPCRRSAARQATRRRRLLQLQWRLAQLLPRRRPRRTSRRQRTTSRRQKRTSRQSRSRLEALCSLCGCSCMCRQCNTKTVRRMGIACCCSQVLEDHMLTQGPAGASSSAAPSAAVPAMSAPVPKVASLEVF